MSESSAPTGTPTPTSDPTSVINKFAREDSPWWSRGGMTVNINGMVVNIVLPVLFMLSRLPEQKENADADADAGAGSNNANPNQMLSLFCGILVVSVLSSIVFSRMHTLYCIVVVPIYFCSLLLLPMGVFEDHNPVLLLILALALGVVKVGIPMSICMHRYAAHAAFQTTPFFNMVLMVIGCLAHQGGPIWWSTTHRVHHKYCDAAADPHSPSIAGVEDAFGFFYLKLKVVQEFIPRHLNLSIALWLLDTWSFGVHSVELLLAYYYFGLSGLFVAYTSAWTCQVTTLWFNVINHPIEQKDDTCTAADYVKRSVFSFPPGTAMAGKYLPFHVLNFTNYIYAQMSSEAAHKHHHDHSRLAKRSEWDIFYWTFLFPLERCGIIWNVQKGAKQL